MQHNLHILNGDPLEITFALIKPDAVKEGHTSAIISHIEHRYFLCDMLKVRWHVEFAERFYAEHRDKAFFPDLVGFMSHAPLICMTLVGPNAIKSWREFMGPTDPKKARIDAPRSLRNWYGDQREGAPMMHNAVHGSDSYERVLREIELVRTTYSLGFGDLALDTMGRFAGKRWDPAKKALEP